MKYSLIVLLAVTLFSCDSKLSDSTSRDRIGIGDTVYLDSGVKYLFVKKSNDTTRVRPYKRVTTHVNLYVDGNLVWTTYDPPRAMNFWYKRDRMVDGFDEVMQYLRAGDRITAIIPPELGYGTQRNGDIPANSTLNFDIEVLMVR